MPLFANLCDTIGAMNDDSVQPLPCSDKLAFDTQKQAQAAATVAAHQHGTKLKPYSCRHCGLWHLATWYED